MFASGAQLPAEAAALAALFEPLHALADAFLAGRE